MVQRYIQFLGLDDTVNLLKANEKPLTPSIRVNTLKLSALDLKQRLEEKGFELEQIEWVPYGFNVIRASHNLGSLHEFLQGYYYLQNVASMLSAIILDPKPNEIVIDMCAAPGSKSTHLAQLMGNEGSLILIDKNKNRIPALETNLRRMGIINSIVLNMDAIDLSELNIKAEKILLDAPCTGEGLIRQDPSRKKNKKLRDIEKLALIQKKLLKAGLNALKEGGKLLYCTCSIAPEENELVINDVINELKNFAIIEISEKYGVNGLTEVFRTHLIEDLEFSQRLYPHIHNSIGFYFCLIKKLD
ncbi:MAG: RsmB/NOP family class I SAM-dependent RNA methyltransferase [Candidatus Lokiarchaeota archaeon]|nr:RsmB/NOP family class I SAM-dependent RNA methyltransferase [Candidatus Lokiarchaeota archaeon]